MIGPDLARMLNVPLGGDIILAFDGYPTTSIEEIIVLREHMNGLKPGTQFVIEVLRGGKMIKLYGTKE